jgi:transposase
MMPKAYSVDLRVRVIEMVRAGASRREAAEVFSLADSTAVKWLQRWEKSGSARAQKSCRRDANKRFAQVAPVL